MIPQISVILGPCAGGAVYSPAMTDFVFMVKGTSHMFITGPDVVKTVTGEDVTQEELGGAITHASKSGVAAFVYDDEQTALDAGPLPARRSCRRTTSRTRPYFETDDDPADRSCDGIVDLIPDAPNKPYDMKKVIAEVVDDGEFLEVNALWAGASISLSRAARSNSSSIAAAERSSRSRWSTRAKGLPGRAGSPRRRRRRGRARRPSSAPSPRRSG